MWVMMDSIKLQTNVQDEAKYQQDPAKASEDIDFQKLNQKLST